MFVYQFLLFNLFVWVIFVFLEKYLFCFNKFSFQTIRCSGINVFFCIWLKQYSVFQQTIYIYYKIVVRKLLFYLNNVFFERRYLICGKTLKERTSCMGKQVLDFDSMEICLPHQHLFVGCFVFLLFVYRLSWDRTKQNMTTLFI